jgi:MFS family permease
LFKYLIAFLIYIDGVGTIIGVAAIYGAELGFGSLELILALLLVQFAGIPYSLIFGRLPNPAEKRRPFYLAFILFNLAALPLAGLAGARLLPAGITGMLQAPFPETASAAGQGWYPAGDARFAYTGAWESRTVSADVLGSETAGEYFQAADPGARYHIPFNGEQIKIVYSMGPEHGVWSVELDGEPYLDPETGQALSIDAYHPTVRYGESRTFQAEEPGLHTLALANTGARNPASRGDLLTLAGVEVLPPARQSNLGAILALILAIELAGLALALVFGKRLFSRLAESLNTKRSILLALAVYTAIAIWGFFLDSVIEFWFLAWMVAVVQGGSQALSRSLFCGLSPSSKSGEFFGLFGIMEKFSGILGPLLFALAAQTFGSSRPAVLSVIAFFLIGGFLLTRVNVEAGWQVARAEDERSYQGDALEAP